MRPPRFKILFAGLTLMLASILPATAEEKHPEKPMLWKVEGRGVEKPAYLFGTLHLGDEVLLNLHPAAQKAFEDSTVVHTEARMDPEAQLAASEFLMREDERTLDEVIGEELADRLNEELKEIRPDLTSELLQPLKTWFTAYNLPYVEDQVAGIKALDLVLWERAVAAGKKTEGMQTPQDQAKGFEALSEKQQTEFLKAVLDYMEKGRTGGKDWKKEAVEIYATGNRKKIYEISNDWMAEISGGKDTEIYKKLFRLILKERDLIMADYVEATLKKQPAEVHFFAAGAAHYTSDDSVPAILEKKGYQVTLVGE